MTICKRCIMDDVTDPTIKFDQNGYCNYCTAAISKKDLVYFPNELGEKSLDNLINRLKSDGKSKKYDCLMGISGGLDSSYLAFLGAEKWGLRILAVHVDDGYDTEISKRNIDQLSLLPNLHLITISPDAEQYKSLTKAYMKASVPNLAVPQDNILFANLYKTAYAYKIPYFLSGGNFALECILQAGNTHSAYDLANLKKIHKKFNDNKINRLDFISEFKADVYRKVMNIQTITPLNCINYIRSKAIDELHDEINFEYYGSKHLENDLTRFIQEVWLYQKFGVDKRKSHLSSMIISDQLTREEALKKVSVAPLSKDEEEELVNKIINSLSISANEYLQLMNSDPIEHAAYGTSHYSRLKANYLTAKKKLLRKSI